MTSEELEIFATSVYECSGDHKRNPRDFDLSHTLAGHPTPRADATLCDEAGVITVQLAANLFDVGVKRALVSEAKHNDGYPRHFWIVDEHGAVFEAAYGGSRRGCYHGYPIRKSDRFFGEILTSWEQHGKV